MRSTVPILLQALARCVLAVPVESTVGKDSPKFDWHKGMTREQEGRESCKKTNQEFLRT